MGAHGAILDHNPAAAELLRTSAMALAVRNGRLAGTTSAIAAWLQKGLAWCAAHRGATTT